MSSVCIIYLFHRRTRASYVYNGCLAWYNVVLTPRVHSKREIRRPTAGDSCDGGISVLYNCLSWYKFVYSHLYHSRQSYNIHVHFTPQASDIGDSMVVHLFGAYFGLTVSRVLHKADDVRSDAKERSVYHSDLFAMIGNSQSAMYKLSPLTLHDPTIPTIWNTFPDHRPSPKNSFGVANPPPPHPLTADLNL